MTEDSRVRPLILVAEDDDDIRALVVHRLERSGYETATAVDGDAALRIALERPPALCIFDVMMPRLDGYELTRRLRAHEATRDIPVILLTARVQEGDALSANVV